MMLGQSSNPVREAFVIGTASDSLAADESRLYALRCAGLPRFKVVVERIGGSAATSFAVSVLGGIGGDGPNLAWPIAPVATMPAAAVGQVFPVELTCVAHDVVFVQILADAVVGPTTIRVQLMATFT